MVHSNGSLYRACRIDPAREMDWGTYTVSLIAFNVVGVVILYLLVRLQGVLPMNPSHVAGKAHSLRSTQP